MSGDDIAIVLGALLLIFFGPIMIFMMTITGIADHPSNTGPDGKWRA